MESVTCSIRSLLFGPFFLHRYICKIRDILLLLCTVASEGGLPQLLTLHLGKGKKFRPLSLSSRWRWWGTWLMMQIWLKTVGTAVNNVITLQFVVIYELWSHLSPPLQQSEINWVLWDEIGNNEIKRPCFKAMDANSFGKLGKLSERCNVGNTSKYLPPLSIE